MTFVLPGGLGQQFAGGYSAWGMTNVVGSPTYSNSNRTITSVGSNAVFIAGTNFVGSGKRYFEVTFTVTSGTSTSGVYESCGVVDPSWSASTALSSLDIGIGTDIDSAGALGSSGGWAVENGSQLFVISNVIANNQVIGVAVDFTSFAPNSVGIWFRLNANWFGGGTLTATFPASTPDVNAMNFTPTMGPLAPGASLDSGGKSLTLNVGNAAFAHAPPTGFVAWG